MISDNQVNPTHKSAAEAGCDNPISPRSQITQEENTYSAFSPHARRCIVALCALAGFLSPFSAFTYFPALEYMAVDLGVSLQLMNLTITMFLVVQAIIPAILGDVADQIGRRPVYILVLSVYSIACILLALQDSYAALMVGRLLQSAGSSGRRISYSFYSPCAEFQLRVKQQSH